MKKIINKIKIRESTINDCEDILRLIKQLEPQFTNDDIKIAEKIFKKIIDKENYLNRVAILSGEGDKKRVVGFISLSFKLTIHDLGLVATINELVVDEYYRNIGVASFLLENAIEEAKSCDCTEIEVSSSLERKDAHSFYKKHNFEEVGKFFALKINNKIK